MSWLSSQTPNYRVASLLNLIFSLLILILVPWSCLLNHWRCDFENSMVSVFDVSYITTFAIPQSKVVLAIFSKLRVISLTKVPDAMNP